MSSLELNFDQSPHRSIPAGAGEPVRDGDSNVTMNTRSIPAGLRAQAFPLLTKCGGTDLARGLSPRVRGNLSDAIGTVNGSI